MEDNQATIKVVRKGYSPKLRSTNKMFNVHVSAIKEVIDLPQVDIGYCHTDFQVADVFTKALAPQKWENALQLLGMDPSTYKGTEVYLASEKDAVPDGTHPNIEQEAEYAQGEVVHGVPLKTPK